MTAWKDLERRVCRALGAERRPSMGAGGYARGSDDDGTAPFSVECKRTQRYGLRRTWIEQARRNGKADGRPWLLVIAEPRDRNPIAVVDFWAFAQLVEESGRLRFDTGAADGQFALGRVGDTVRRHSCGDSRSASQSAAHTRRGLAMSTTDPHRPEADEAAPTDPDTDRDTDADDASSEPTDPDTDRDTVEDDEENTEADRASR